MKYFWSMSFFLILIIFISQAFNIKEQQNTIVGLWEIEAIEYFDSSSGKWRQHDWMKGGKGLLHYDNNNTMSLHFTPNGYNSLPDSSSIGLMNDYWYIASYRILPEKNIVEHTRIMHSKPSEWGKVVERTFSFHVDTLILSPIEFNMRLKWTRVD